MLPNAIFGLTNCIDLLSNAVLIVLKPETLVSSAIGLLENAKTSLLISSE